MLHVRSPAPLNDHQWHRVDAERNIKEAVLQLDGRHRESRVTPPQGRGKVELHSDLYVGRKRSSVRQQSQRGAVPAVQDVHAASLQCVKQKGLFVSTWNHCVFINVYFIGTRYLSERLSENECFSSGQAGIVVLGTQLHIRRLQAARVKRNQVHFWDDNEIELFVFLFMKMFFIKLY